MGVCKLSVLHLASTYFCTFLRPVYGCPRVSATHLAEGAKKRWTPPRRAPQLCPERYHVRTEGLRRGDPALLLDPVADLLHLWLQPA